MEQCFPFLLAVTILLLSLESRALLLASSPQRNDDWQRNASQTPEPPRNSCPRYFPGVSLDNRPLEGCKTGSLVKNADHVDAFGLLGSEEDFGNCPLPEFPQTNQRVCYRTTIDLCNTTNYRIYLNRRSLRNLQKNCPHESENLDLFDDRVVFHSPRYQCRKKNNKPYNYRNKEFCLYNISVPNCDSGVVSIETPEQNAYQLQRRVDGKCKDYLQFYSMGPDNTLQRTEKICGSGHLQGMRLNGSSNILAVFWTDTSSNSLGFRVRAMCAEMAPTEMAPTEMSEMTGSGANIQN